MKTRAFTAIAQQKIALIFFLFFFSTCSRLSSRESFGSLSSATGSLVGVLSSNKANDAETQIFFVEAQPETNERAEEEEQIRFAEKKRVELRKLELDLKDALEEVERVRQEKADKEQLLKGENEQKRELRKELEESKRKVKQAKEEMEKLRKEKERNERESAEESERNAKAFKMSEDLVLEFQHFAEALKIFALGKFARAKELSIVFVDVMKEKTSAYAVLMRTKSSEFYSLAKVNAIEIGLKAQKKAYEFDLPKKFDEAKTRAKKEYLPKVQKTYKKMQKKAKALMKKVEPHMKTAKKHVQTAKMFIKKNTPKDLKEYFAFAFAFLLQVREDLVKFLAAKLLLVYQNVDFFAPYANKSYALFSANKLVQTIQYYVMYRMLWRLIFGRVRKTETARGKKKGEKKQLQSAAVRNRSVEFSPPKTRTMAAATAPRSKPPAPFAAKRTEK